MLTSSARLSDASPPTLETTHSVDSARIAAMTRLMDSMLHDVRNPLNALAINTEVLSEKLKDERGAVPPLQEKNLRAIREQVQRVDAVLRQFSQFITPPRGESETELSEVTARAVAVLAHESRRGRVTLTVEISPDVRVRVPDSAGLYFLIYRTLLRAIERAPAASEVRVQLSKSEGRGVFSVENAAGARAASDEVDGMLRQLAHEVGGELVVKGDMLKFSFSVA